MGGALRELNSFSTSISHLGLTALVSTFLQLYEFGERPVEKTMMVRLNVSLEASLLSY